MADSDPNATTDAAAQKKKPSGGLLDIFGRLLTGALTGMAAAPVDPYEQSSLVRVLSGVGRGFVVSRDQQEQQVQDAQRKVHFDLQMRREEAVVQKYEDEASALLERRSWIDKYLRPGAEKDAAIEQVDEQEAKIEFARMAMSQPGARIQEMGFEAAGDIFGLNVGRHRQVNTSGQRRLLSARTAHAISGIDSRIRQLKLQHGTKTDLWPPDVSEQVMALERERARHIQEEQMGIMSLETSGTLGAPKSPTGGPRSGDLSQEEIELFEQLKAQEPGQKLDLSDEGNPGNPEDDRKVALISHLVKQQHPELAEETKVPMDKQTLIGNLRKREKLKKLILARLAFFGYDTTGLHQTIEDIEGKPKKKSGMGRGSVASATP